MTDAGTAVRRQVADGHDLDHYADDLKAVTDHLNLRDAVHVGHSTGGGEVVRYLARHGDKNVAKAAIISAVPPLMVRTPANPPGPLSAKLLKNGTLKTYKEYPHGMITTQADVINADLLAFIKS